MIEEFKLPEMRSFDQKASVRAAAAVLEETCGNFVQILAFFVIKKYFSLFINCFLIEGETRLAKSSK